MNSEVFLDNDFSENEESIEADNELIKKVNFRFIRILICALTFIGLLFCKHFYAPYYAGDREFYCMSFKNDDEKIFEIKNSILAKLESLRLNLKSKINDL